ncbi:hypothetical protein AB205_0077260 [Aquarana catesbeiana]|uniref:Uncharacterized protein n=1 Tax=Aquarana catesbeiana TaxID=8400 RepID=A0A2G9SEB0_AQUCT|nr:hypothetical protein AB205_0077260 [Aquarana catesbeiana]
MPPEDIIMKRTWRRYLVTFTLRHFRVSGCLRWSVERTPFTEVDAEQLQLSSLPMCDKPAAPVPGRHFLM